MASALPPTQRVLTFQADTKAIALETVPLDTPGPGQVLIKNAAVAQNPADWKIIDYGMVSAGQGMGWDFAGSIVALGEGVTEYKIGDRVASCHVPVNSVKTAQNAFCEYTLAAAKPLLRVPDNITDEEASTIPLASLSALHLLNVISGVPKRAPLGGRAILIWGGSSSVGQFAIQLAHIAGYKVITTASPKNHALVKSLGATVAIDYRAPDVVEQIVAASGRDGVDYVFDAISEGNSAELASKTLRKDGPRKVALVNAVDLSNLNQSADYYQSVPSALLNDDLSIGGVYYPRNKADFDLGVAFFENAARWLQEGRLKPNPVTVRPGGLSGIQDGLDFMKAGKVSGSKLVYRVADTPV
ncbi:NAD(P)-binding protein [Dentipellis sp. KUC8613]|nr:NAD(P)-binding protein [Dentipellis sp. KUC8613]